MHPHGFPIHWVSPLQRDFSSLVFFIGRRPRQGRAAVDGISMPSSGTGSQPLEHVAEYTYPHRRDVRRCKVPCACLVRHQGVLQKAQAELGALVKKKRVDQMGFFNSTIGNAREARIRQHNPSLERSVVKRRFISRSLSGLRHLLAITAMEVHTYWKGCKRKKLRWQRLPFDLTLSSYIAIQEMVKLNSMPSLTLRSFKITAPTPRRVSQPQGKQLEKKCKIQGPKERRRKGSVSLIPVKKKPEL